MTSKKTHWLRTSIIILVICAIVGLGLTSFLFFGKPSPTSASATIVFTFDGAADGIAPNGVAFDISDIARKEVLSAALEEASMTDKYTVEQLQECLVARGVYPDDMARQVTNYESLLNFTANREATVTNFHPTTFNIALYNNFDKSIGSEQLLTLIKAIMTSYKAYFAKAYANSLEEKDAIFVLDEYDYPQQLDIIQTRLSAMTQYAQTMYDDHPTFRYDGYGFSDINVRLNNLITSDISRLNADLTMNALTRDTARLLTQYQFEIRDLSNQLDKQTAQLDKLDKLIDSYQKNEIIYLSTTDSLTKIDGNSSVTYDSLVMSRKNVSEGITKINSQIASYQLKLGDLLKDQDDTSEEAGTGESTDVEGIVSMITGGEQNPKGSSAIDTSDAQAVKEMTDEEITQAAAAAERLARSQVADLEKSISTLVTKGEAIIKDFHNLLEAFNAQEINDLTVTVTGYKYNTPNVVSGAFIRAAIKTAGPICAIGFMLCMVLIIISRKREEKRAAKE